MNPRSFLLAVVPLLCWGSVAVASEGGGVSYEVVEVTSASLDDVVAKGPVLLEIHASWCTHCRRFAPSYEHVAQQLGPDGITVARVDGSVHRLLLQRFRTSGFPSFYLMDGGKAFEFVGGRSIDALVGFSRSHGLSNGKEMTGIWGPAGPLWKAVSVAVGQWESGLQKIKASDASPALIGGMAAFALIAVLCFFAVIIHFATKPPPVRPKTN